eukprot:GHVH01001018.1.p1 GENE.GHVH01001018.1~~GHVH01001018.1.p1  ORF type:complete len:155 (+),score=22.23 GHVH01001018.1:167-631(+)
MSYWNHHLIPYSNSSAITFFDRRFSFNLKNSISNGYPEVPIYVDDSSSDSEESDCGTQYVTQYALKMFNVVVETTNSCKSILNLSSRLDKPTSHSRRVQWLEATGDEGSLSTTCTTSTSPPLASPPRVQHQQGEASTSPPLASPPRVQHQQLHH